jgi:hypothetical protein
MLRSLLYFEGEVITQDHFRGHWPTTWFIICALLFGLVWQTNSTVHVKCFAHAQTFVLTINNLLGRGHDSWSFPRHWPTTWCIDCALLFGLARRTTVYSSKRSQCMGLSRRKVRHNNDTNFNRATYTVKGILKKNSLNWTPISMFIINLQG